MGGYWTRSHDLEVDLVGADRAPVARRVTFVGSVKWRERRPFDDRDLAALIVARDRVPGADRDTPLVAVSRAHGASVGPALIYRPEDLLGAWRE